jgi:signal transduction histidine kinase
MGFTDKPTNSEDKPSIGCQPNEWQQAAESVSGLLWICDQAGSVEALVRMGMPATESAQQSKDFASGPPYQRGPSHTLGGATAQPAPDSTQATAQAQAAAQSQAPTEHWVNLLDESSKQRALSRWAGSQRENTPFFDWLKFPGPNSRPLRCLTRLIPYKTATERGRGWIGIALDFQSLGNMTSEGKPDSAKTELFELAAKATKDVLWDWDLITQELWWGENFYSKFGYTRKEISPDISSWKTRIHPGDLERVTRGIEESIVQRKENWEAQYRFRMSSGEYAIIHDRGYIKLRADGTPKRMVGAMIDITKETEAHTEILRLNSEMKQLVARRNIEIASATSALEAFSYSVSHDLRAPIRHIIGFVELLKRSNGDRLNDEGLRYLSRIIDSGKRMGDLIEALLALSRLGRVEMRISQLNLESIVEAVQRDFSIDLSGRRIEWKIHPLPKLWGDEILIRQVFVNLIDNALKYTRLREVATIEIGAEDRGNAWELFIRDNGVGFDMRYSHRLFQVFQRLHSEKEFEGFGVGLANVHRIIGLHGGTVWAEAEPNKGATIFFTLPKSNILSKPNGTTPDQPHVNP